MTRIACFLPLISLCSASFFKTDSSNVGSVEFLRNMREVDLQSRLAQDQRQLQEELLAAAVQVKLGLSRSDLPPFMRALEEEADDDYNYVGGGDQDDAMDLTGYALKYIGCQNIHQYDDDQAAYGKTPLAMNRFVMLRLCPKESCSAYNSYGCNYNFGEYTLPMSDYLKIMSKYHVKQYDQYCSTCKLCMNFVVPDNYGDDVYGDDVAIDDAIDDAVANDDANGNRKLDNNGYNDYYDQYANQYYNQYGYYANNYGQNGQYNNNNQNDGQYQYQNGYPWYIDANGQCIFEGVCNGYVQTCQSYSENEAGFSDYFQCQATQVGNANVYTGPHCRSDGHTIGIGIYEDQYCNAFLGDNFNVNGENNAVSFDDDDLKAYYDGTCISCKASDSYALVTDDAYGTQEYTYPLCNVLYEYSAKCNKRIAVADTYDDEEASQSENEDSVCDFIGSLVEKNYDEYGEVYLNSFRLSNWNKPEEYLNIVRRTTPWQIFALIGSLFIMLTLLLYSCFLHRQLRRRVKWDTRSGLVSPWKPTGAATAAGRVSRQSSGIVSSRSIDSAAAAAQEKGAFVGESGGAFA